jgi:hypothetical protein
MEGVRELGVVVCSHIASLQSEIQSLRKEVSGEGVDEAGPSTAEADADKVFRGTLLDRYETLFFYFK